jgi:signal transduction histidine kinase
VRDNGVGFGPEDAGRLFRPFERLHGARFEGFGVGLSIVRRIVEHHGGRVWAEGRPGEGATFRFTLGAQPAPAGRPGAELQA